MVEADVQTLKYVQRYGDKTAGVLPLIAGLPPKLRKSNALGQSAGGELQVQTRIAELERELTQSARHAREQLAAAREEAARELELALAAESAAHDRIWGTALEGAVQDFRSKQEMYFQNAETQVVRLALAIAARVLHREAQIDPLLLRGPVRVALEEVQQSAVCVLEVSPDAAEDWRKWLSAGDTQGKTIEIRIQQGAARGHCRLEIEGSSADLSTEAQLAEIERGFFDLLQQRPTVVRTEQP